MYMKLYNIIFSAARTVDWKVWFSQFAHIRGSNSSYRFRLLCMYLNLYANVKLNSWIGNGKLHKTILLVAGLAVLAVGVEGLNVGYVMPSVKCEMNLTNNEQGLINGAGFVGVVLSAHFWGFLADTWGRQRVLRFALLCGFLFSAISSASYTAVMLLITRLCVGLWYVIAS